MTAKTRVLVVEDEEAYIEGLVSGLSREGFDVAVARTGPQALEEFGRQTPDVVLLDLMLPGMSGVDVCRRIRSTSKIPVIMVTAKDSELDTVVGLEVGADDYIVKPYRIRELVARIGAVLRRTTDESREQGDEERYEDEEIAIGDVRMNLASHTVSVRGEDVVLTLKEFELLEALMSNAGRALSRSQLIDTVWAHDGIGETKTVDVHVMRLRNKIEVDPGTPTYISTIRGLGYRFEKDPRRSGAHG